MAVITVSNLEDLLYEFNKRIEDDIIPCDDPKSLMIGWHFVDSNIYVRVSLSTIRNISLGNHPLSKHFYCTSSGDMIEHIRSYIVSNMWESCQHQWINVGFTSLKIVCKICDCEKS